MESWIDDAKTKWNEFEDVDKFIIGSAGVLTIGGALISLFSGNGSAFLGGAGISAVLVVVRAVTKDKGGDDPIPTSSTRYQNQAKGSNFRLSSRMPEQSPRRTVDYTYGGGELGAPIGEMVDNGPVTTFNGLVSKDEAKDFPMWHRHVEVDVRTEPLDDRIRWATNDPLGPYRGSTVTGFW